MEPNPYASPTEKPSPENRKKGMRVFTFAAAWLVLFLIPSFSVIVVNCFPIPPFLSTPSGDNVLSRISLAIGVPADILLLVSLIGCETLILFAPLSRGWKITIALAWFPLAVAQLFVIALALVLAGNPL